MLISSPIRIKTATNVRLHINTAQANEENRENIVGNYTSLQTKHCSRSATDVVFFIELHGQTTLTCLYRLLSDQVFLKLIIATAACTPMTSASDCMLTFFDTIGQTSAHQASNNKYSISKIKV